MHHNYTTTVFTVLGYFKILGFHGKNSNENSQQLNSAFQYYRNSFRNSSCLLAEGKVEHNTEN